MLHAKFKRVLAAATAAALIACLGTAVATTSAQAATASNGVTLSDSTSWAVPTSAMTNVVKIGDKYYKVISTSTGTNWTSAGPDWLGVSNSASLIGGNTTMSGYNGTLIGIYASSANQVPNAFNWNAFYNLYAAEQGLDTVALTTQTSSTSLDSSTGVAAGLKYRPEILWSDTYSSYETYIEYIRNGQYYSEFPSSGSSSGDQQQGGGGQMGGAPSDDEEEDTGTLVEDTSAYAAPYDSEYTPYAIGMSNGSSTSNIFSISKLLYKMAYYCEVTEAATADYDGLYNGTAVTDENATVISMNALPRTTRYEASEENAMSARDCALAYEMVEKGAVWYVLSQIAAGNVEKKTVAFITSDPDADSNTANIVAFDVQDEFSPQSNNNNAGFAGVSGTAFNQLVVGTYTLTSNSYASYVSCTATADDLAACDVIFITGAGGTNGTTSYTQDTLKEWMVSNCTTTKNKAAAANIQYACISPSQMNAKNFSVDKSIYSVYCLDFAYPELFPNMELTSYWYNCIYHVKSANLKEVMQWTLYGTSLPDETSLSAISDSYSVADCEAKFYEGYAYYAECGDTDEVISTLKANCGLITGNELGTVDALDDNGLAITDEDGNSTTAAWADIYYVPSATYAEWAAEYAENYSAAAVELATQTIKVSTKAKTIKAKKLAKKAQTFKIGASAKGKITCTKKSGSKKITITKAGKITVKKGTKKGTYKIKVKIKAKATSKYAAASKTVTIKVTVK